MPPVYLCDKFSRSHVKSEIMCSAVAFNSNIIDVMFKCHEKERNNKSILNMFKLLMFCKILHDLKFPSVLNVKLINIF